MKILPLRRIVGTIRIDYLREPGRLQQVPPPTLVLVGCSINETLCPHNQWRPARQGPRKIPAFTKLASPQSPNERGDTPRAGRGYGPTTATEPAVRAGRNDLVASAR